ncbi:MAG: dienelactone hydrolase family protein [Clostridia bacterium]|nr:dienelactone hydrolase family protein [Clostridia bacterium]
MKRLLSILLALVIAVSAAFPAFSMSIDEGVDNLRTLWSRDKGPEVGGEDIDYSYYSPVANGADDSKKYPLVIIMAGALEGLVEGFELTANALASWTADEYQSKFNNGAAFLLIGRAPEEHDYYWDASAVAPAFKAAIDDFIVKNPCVDTDRIYCIGWCLGGTGSINLSTMYPGFFAASMVMCPSRGITEGEAQILKDKPVWLMGCKKDTYVDYNRVMLKSWNNLKKYAKNTDKIRFTSYDEAPKVTLADTFDFIKNHDVWSNVAYDMKSGIDIYKGEKTVDGKETELASPSVIEWLNSYTLDKNADTKGELPGAFYRFFHENVKNFSRVILIKLILRFLDTFGYIDLY